MKRMMRYMLALLLLLSARTAIPAQGPGGATTNNNLYIVRMAELPVASYTGGVPGLQATKPGRGQKIDPNSGTVVVYAGYLNNRHSQALAAVGAGRKVYDYQFTFNGFTAELTAAQAEALKSVSGVLDVTKDELVSQDTSNTPTFLGLDAPGGLWDQLGGVGSAGDGVIIGMVDSGVWPESMSFSDRTGENGNGSKGGKLSYQQIPGWHGKCTP